jgi:hypothetical protein
VKPPKMARGDIQRDKRKKPNRVACSPCDGQITPQWQLCLNALVESGWKRTWLVGCTRPRYGIFRIAKEHSTEAPTKAAQD